MFDDFISLLFPQICMACGNTLFRQEYCICTYCKYHLPKTNFHLDEDNPVSKMFWGRVDIRSAVSCYYFNKGSRVQQLMHHFKYHGHKEIGNALGELYGCELKKHNPFMDISLIIPVPLHPIKYRKRGYNQSAFFAEGLSKGLGVQHNSSILFRSYNSETQTRKSRYERWKNVETIFQIRERKPLEGKHILLVDDVVTTGSTLEACAQTLLQVAGTTVSIATIACA